MHLCVIFILKSVMWVYLSHALFQHCCMICIIIYNQGNLFYLKNAKYCFSNILPLKNKRTYWFSISMDFTENAFSQIIYRITKQFLSWKVEFAFQGKELICYKFELKEKTWYVFKLLE